MSINSKVNIADLPNRLVDSLQNIYTPAGLHINTICCEAEGKDYDAYRFKLNDYNIVFRTAKTTPTKVGQFVTIWKRPKKTSPIEHLHIRDDIDFLIISSTGKNCAGDFIFSKKILVDNKIISTDDFEGKRAIRVYPPWVQTKSAQAVKTQRWQLNNFYLFGQNPEDSACLKDTIFNKI
ncbi:MAG: MepB family protein [Legionellales bacterium]|nr:MepB family protein [Legionellales bacterium]